jgi:metal-responsive CopG/Arc/MetJ family transcriptional regulator
MATSTVNVSFQEDFLGQIDQIAKFEFRSRAELIREATRLYVERKQKWQNIFTYGSKMVSKNNLSEQDVMTEIKNNRRNK